MMQQVYKSFPNNNPITGICVVEDPGKCPTDFTVVLRTLDQDSDADLWRETSFFGRRISRYLCISKTEGILDHVVQNVLVINEKEYPPEGFSHIPRTLDADSKAWRKKQLCYSYARRTLTSTAVTDIILLGKTKHPPDGFSVAGEINGITVCFKTIRLTETSNGTPSIFETPNAVTNGGSTNGYPNLNRTASPNNGDYVNLIPVRPAPLPPIGPKPVLPHSPAAPAPMPAPSIPTYGTLSGHLGLEGVPFILNTKFAGASKTSTPVPVIKARTAEELDEEYHYDFRLERQTST